MFNYPQHAHQRRHGPRGYNDYRSFKPWLRDEFAFRCVYCLWRETWCAAGDAAFSVEHLQPQSRQPDLARDYTNMVYACCGDVGDARMIGDVGVDTLLGDLRTSGSETSAARNVLWPVPLLWPVSRPSHTRRP